MYWQRYNNRLPVEIHNEQNSPTSWSFYLRQYYLKYKYRASTILDEIHRYLIFWRIVFICSLFQLSIQSSTAIERYGRSRETYTRSARSVNVPRETYTRSARTLIEPYNRETYTRSARSINEPYSAHQSNFVLTLNCISHFIMSL